MTRTTRMVVEIVTFIVIASLVMGWACARAKHRYEKIQQWHQYEECLDKNAANPGNYICVPPRFIIDKTLDSQN